MKNSKAKGLIIFDHDGTLINTQTASFASFKGVRELLEKLVKNDFELAVWTLRPRASTIDSLNKNGIASYFNELYCSGDGPGKPHVFGLESIQQKSLSSFSKDKIIHIGDSIGDIVGAHQFGISVIAALWNDPEMRDPLRAADYFANEVHECASIVEKHFGTILN